MQCIVPVENVTEPYTHCTSPALNLYENDLTYPLISLLGIPGSSRSGLYLSVNPSVSACQRSIARSISSTHLGVDQSVLSMALSSGESGDLRT